MIDQMFGRKLKQTQIFTETGQKIPVTIVSVLSHKVYQIKTKEKDGYKSVKVFLDENKKKTTKKLLREIRLKNDEELPEIGTEILSSSVFNTGDLISVSGITKGKGFQGGVKRHGFKGGPKTHGQSDRLRGPGSIGMATTPGRVYKGKRMAGHMGAERATVRGLKVVRIDEKERQIVIKGLVPGPVNNLIIIKKQ